MKLGVQLLLIPMFTGAVALSGGGLNAWLMQREAQANAAATGLDFDELRGIGQVQVQLGQMHAGVYRTVALIASLDEAAVQTYRGSLNKQADGLDKALLLLGQARPDDQKLSQGLARAQGQLKTYVKQADAAVDMASVDPNTGVAAMQSANTSFDAISQTMKEVGSHVDDAAGTELAASAQRSQRQTWWLLLASALATSLAVLGSAVLMRRVAGALRQASMLAEAVAAGDLSAPPASSRDDEIGDLQRALGSMVSKLRGSMHTVQLAAQQIAQAGAEIASGNQDLSQRTEQTASNLQQAASSLEELTGTVRESAGASAQASALATTARQVALLGGEAVTKVVSTMQDIHASSQKIADIIGVIDGIAFQTNILALNAAVEAARAGEQGRGFAVVAGEVRNLAQRSAAAAREIKALIGQSNERVATGARQVQQAGATMGEIVGSVQRVAQIISELTLAASEQSSGLGQVNSAVNRLDGMTQQNAALVEQSAAAAEQLSLQARSLTDLVAKFRLSAVDKA